VALTPPREESLLRSPRRTSSFLSSGGFSLRPSQLRLSKGVLFLFFEQPYSSPFREKRKEKQHGEETKTMALFFFRPGKGVSSFSGLGSKGKIRG
jgi:hypothetical protein